MSKQKASDTNSAAAINNTSTNKFTPEQIKEIQRRVAADPYNCKATFSSDGTAETVIGKNPVEAVINCGNIEFAKGPFTLNYKVDWKDKKAVENMKQKINAMLETASKGNVAISKITINGIDDKNIITPTNKDGNITSFDVSASTPDNDSRSKNKLTGGG